MPGIMSHWRAAVEETYPQMAKALDAIGAAIGNRPIDVFEAVVDLDQPEAERLRAVIRGAFEDAREAWEAYQDSPAGRIEADGLAVRLTMVLAGCFQLGVWLGEGRLATLDVNRVRRGVAIFDKQGGGPHG